MPPTMRGILRNPFQNSPKSNLSAALTKRVTFADLSAPSLSESSTVTADSESAPRNPVPAEPVQYRTILSSKAPPNSDVRLAQVQQNAQRQPVVNSVPLDPQRHRDEQTNAPTQLHTSYKTGQRYRQRNVDDCPYCAKMRQKYTDFASFSSTSTTSSDSSQLSHAPTHPTAHKQSRSITHRIREHAPPVAESGVYKRRTSRAARLALMKANPSRHFSNNVTSSATYSRRKRVSRVRHESAHRRSSSQLSSKARHLRHPKSSSGQNSLTLTSDKRDRQRKLEERLEKQKRDDKHVSSHVKSHVSRNAQQQKPDLVRQSHEVGRKTPRQPESSSQLVRVPSKPDRYGRRRQSAKSVSSSNPEKVNAEKSAALQTGRNVELQSAREYVASCLRLSATKGVLLALDGRALHALVSTCQQLRRRFRNSTPQALRVSGLRDMLIQQEKMWRECEDSSDGRRELHKRRAALLRFVTFSSVDDENYLRAAPWRELQNVVINSLALRGSRKKRALS